MTDIRKVTTTKAYGNMIFHVSEVMEKQNINRNQLSRNADVRFEVIDRLYKGVDVQRLDVDILCRICYVLDCKLGDLIEYSGE